MAEVSAIALFCDDIREEKTGQYSLIGVVGDNINVPDFPGAIPKFAIYVRINLPVDFEPCDFETFLNFPNGERILLNTIEHDLVAKTINDAKAEHNLVAGIYSHLIAAPFAVQQEGRIWLELVWNHGKIILGSLNFGKAKPAHKNESEVISSSA
ncbi:MAG: hypothetical protein R3E09_02485 [Novosphingobium sp.]|nr:hypothetical protein [Novosphingobium sp.]MCB2077530.1 hypothetical protein [Novosphingobium sp.]